MCQLYKVLFAANVMVICLFGCVEAVAQQPAGVDFSGKIRQYDSTFTGIGPKVYFLPPPPTKEEVLSNLYEEKLSEGVVVREYLDNLKYTQRLKAVGNTTAIMQDIESRMDSTLSLEGLILTEIAHQAASGNIDMAANLQNNLAMEYLSTGTVKEAFALLEEALSSKKLLNNRPDIDALTHNLAVAYEYLQDLSRARALHQEIYERAVSSRNSAQQAYSQMNIALVKAKQGSYHEAERELIRQIIPAFKRMNNGEGHAAAFSTLAYVYTLQQKYPEAQWFLLQAKEIAIQKRLHSQMPDIIFSLAENKKYSGNQRVAIQEYKAADDLARKDNLFGMQLAIQDALGDLYHQFGEYEQAATALDKYDSLKTRFFRRSVSANN